MLIATLPPVDQEDLAEKIVSHPLIGAVRYNTGYETDYPPPEILSRVFRLTERYGKKLWIDLEGRQLRVENWSWPRYGGRIELNRELEINLPAEINFRGDPTWYAVKIAHGKSVYLKINPKKAIGRGQTVNIRADGWKEKNGYLKPADREYLEAALTLGISSFFLSFVESDHDLTEMLMEIFRHRSGEDAKGEIELTAKIESQKALAWLGQVEDGVIGYSLMAARDDLFTNLCADKAAMIAAQELIIGKDPEAILASRIFSGLEKEGGLTMGDLADIRLAALMGYKNFMLSDGISHYHFDEAMAAWENCQILLERR
jgi:hypothetical protein